MLPLASPDPKSGDWRNKGCVLGMCIPVHVLNLESLFLPHSCRDTLYFEAEVYQDGDQSNLIKYEVGVREVVCSIES